MTDKKTRAPARGKSAAVTPVDETPIGEQASAETTPRPETVETKPVESQTVDSQPVEAKTPSTKIPLLRTSIKRSSPATTPAIELVDLQPVDVSSSETPAVAATDAKPARARSATVKAAVAASANTTDSIISPAKGRSSKRKPEETVSVPLADVPLTTEPLTSVTEEPSTTVEAPVTAAVEEPILSEPAPDTLSQEPEPTVAGTTTPEPATTTVWSSSNWKADPPPPGRPTGFFQSPGVKFIMIGFISLLLLIPAMLVWGLTEERAQRAEEVSARIAKGWGGPQVINGPYLAVPYTIDRSQTVDGKVILQKTTEWALLMPETLNVDADLNVEERKLSIYTLPVYNSKLKISGAFGASLLEDLSQFGGPLNLDRAVLVMNIGDISGIRSQAGVRIDGGAVLPFEPGMKDITATADPLPGTYDGGYVSRSGVHRTISPALIDKGFTFDIDLSLNGSRNFSVAPAGQTTNLTTKANWPHPGFEGLFLPETKTIDASHFEAKWTIPYLARGVDKAVAGPGLPLTGSMMAVNLVEPVKFYQVISRTLKYSIGFISVVFLAVFIIELKSGRLVHWIQYVLTGLALVVFYVLLLALSEHTGFEVAYILAALATTMLISAYVGMVTQSRRSGLQLGFVLALAYAVLYLILREDEYALLAGALLSFITIAATMFATRNVDWGNPGRKELVAA
ncbi:cell envelope integrity protein CreD [Pararhizobium sp.]|uniref:cell envelope integrity protein CreD n=1 Tax=Pararhizobium sp. TaxID=1977563 RepID=UPI00271E8356|nr:cell envelope integrity protein CreD [Pararhizobium sp.]MDO9416024.1 cell envelope integrity protein CreD [Pararhizobium sp.]